MGLPEKQETKINTMLDEVGMAQKVAEKKKKTKQEGGKNDGGEEERSNSGKQQDGVTIIRAT